MFTVYLFGKNPYGYYPPVLATLMLSGCGQKGALYLPEMTTRAIPPNPARTLRDSVIRITDIQTQSNLHMAPKYTFFV